jgi:hypothetical protein
MEFSEIGTGIATVDSGGQRQLETVDADGEQSADMRELLHHARPQGVRVVVVLMDEDVAMAKGGQHRPVDKHDKGNMPQQMLELASSHGRSPHEIIDASKNASGAFCRGLDCTKAAIDTNTQGREVGSGLLDVVNTETSNLQLVDNAVHVLIAELGVQTDHVPVIAVRHNTHRSDLVRGIEDRCWSTVDNEAILWQARGLNAGMDMYSLRKKHGPGKTHGQYSKTWIDVVATEPRGIVT